MPIQGGRVLGAHPRPLYNYLLVQTEVNTVPFSFVEIRFVVVVVIVVIVIVISR